MNPSNQPNHVLIIPKRTFWRSVVEYGGVAGGCLMFLLFFAAFITGCYFVARWMNSLSRVAQFACLFVAVSTYTVNFCVWAFEPDDRVPNLWWIAFLLNRLLILPLFPGLIWLYLRVDARFGELAGSAVLFTTGLAPFLLDWVLLRPISRIQDRRCREAITKFLAERSRGTLMSLTEETWSHAAVFVTRGPRRPFAYSYSYIAIVMSETGIEEEIHLSAGGDLRTLFSPTVTIPEVITDPDILARGTGTITIVDE